MWYVRFNKGIYSYQNVKFEQWMEVRRIALLSGNTADVPDVLCWNIWTSWSHCTAPSCAAPVSPWPTLNFLLAGGKYHQWLISSAVLSLYLRAICFTFHQYSLAVRQILFKISLFQVCWFPYTSSIVYNSRPTEPEST